MYEFDPTASVDPAAGGDPRRVLGGQAAMWSEHLRPVLLDYAVWPRAAAMAERLWSPAEDTKARALGGLGRSGWEGGRALGLRSTAGGGCNAGGGSGGRASCARPCERPFVEVSRLTAPPTLLLPRPCAQSAKAAQPRLEQLMRQLEARGLRPSPLNYQGLNWRCVHAPCSPGAAC